MTEFRAFPKIPRLNREMIITEKIDGTNAAIVIEKYPLGTHMDGHDVGRIVTLTKEFIESEGGLPDFEYVVSAQSRSRLITPEDDNYGFAKWVHENAHALAEALGEGTHYGEWWGQGIQRKYDMDHKHFSLFNVHRWKSLPFSEYGLDNVSVVPVLYNGQFNTNIIDDTVEGLRIMGSIASRGFMKPEGVIIWHEAAQQMFKVTCEGDEKPKGQQ
jgi:hypothetical protein